MEVNPSILEFKGDFLKPNTEYLTLTNTSNGPLAFKVKTTAPKLYSVRPNANIIKPGDSLKISINLQAFSQPLSKFYKCKDKFLIVALPCTSELDASKVSEVWNDLEKANKSKLISSKLKVNYIIDDNGDDIKEEKLDDATTPVGSAPVSASDNAGTTAGAVGAAGAAGVVAGAAGAAAATGATGNAKSPETLGNYGNDVIETIDGSGAPTSDKAVASGAKLNDTEVTNKNEYDEASYNEINKLSEKFDKTESEEVATKTGDEPFGLSMIMTVILMLLAFIIGWLIF